MHRSIFLGLGLVSGLAGQAFAQDSAVTGGYRVVAQANPMGVPDTATSAAQRGEKFFNATHGGEWSCASCHLTDPRQAGRHAKTNKIIQPLAPAANPQRLTNPEKVQKWFRRNCNDVLGRHCTVQEQDDVIAYLRSLAL